MKNKLGVTFDGVKNAPYADFPNGIRPLTADEATRMQHSVDNIYEIFKGRVAAGRKMTVADVDSIAQGRVWSGTDALQIKLVDALGGLDRAIASAATLAKVKDYKVVTYPEPIDRFETMIRRLNGNTAAAAVVKTAVEKELGTEYEWYKHIKQLKNMNGKLMMLLPFQINTQ